MNMNLTEQNPPAGLDYEELMKSGKLRKLQLHLCGMLETFDRICQEENLTYFAFGGTLLGAVRHKGFIPWDSDIDVAMPREDFERFRNVTFRKFPENLIIQDYHTDHNFTALLLRVCDVNTTVQFQGSRTVLHDSGAFIDVFPLDHLKHKEGLRTHLQSILVKNMLQSLSVRAGENQAENRTFKQKTANFIAHMFSRERWMRLRERLSVCKNSKDTLYYINLGSHYDYRRQIYEKARFYPVVRLPFEYFTIAVPSDYDYVLKKFYGSRYMEIPPENKRHYEDHIIIRLDIGEDNL